MEGELWKWTNYWNGWQSRWFILDDGILSYFKSYDEVSQGCKGSISLNVCEIIVNSSDPTRLDLNVSNEQYIYLRANSEKERQQWLVALGSAKASLANRQQRRRISSTASSVGEISSNHAIPQFEVQKSTIPSHNSSIKSMNLAALKSKKSELRLYCDLLMQQVHTMKQTSLTPKQSNGNDIEPDYLSDSNSPPPFAATDESHLLSATCDTFIKTLDELMEMADVQFSIYGPPQLENGGRRNSRERSTTPTLNYVRQSSHGSLGGGRNRLISESSRASPTIFEKDNENSSTENHSASAENSSPGFKAVFGGNFKESLSNQSSPKKVSISTIDEKQKSNNFETRSASINFPLKRCFPVPSEPDCDIKTGDFINASLKILVIYEFLGKGFAPIRNELKGHIKGLETKYLTDTDTFKNIRMIVLSEHFAKKSGNPHSATFAISWIHRHLSFLHCFLERFGDSEDKSSVVESLEFSYRNSLLEHHDQVIQNVFAVAIQTAPHRTDFTQSFGTSEFFRMKPLLDEYLDSLHQCLIALTTNMETKCDK